MALLVGAIERTFKVLSVKRVAVNYYSRIIRPGSLNTGALNSIRLLEYELLAIALTSSPEAFFI